MTLPGGLTLEADSKPWGTKSTAYVSIVDVIAATDLQTIETRKFNTLGRQYADQVGSNKYI